MRVVFVASILALAAHSAPSFAQDSHWGVCEKRRLDSPLLIITRPFPVQLAVSEKLSNKVPNGNPYVPQPELTEIWRQHHPGQWDEGMECQVTTTKEEAVANYDNYTKNKADPILATDAIPILTVVAVDWAPDISRDLDASALRMVKGFASCFIVRPDGTGYITAPFRSSRYEASPGRGQAYKSAFLADLNRSHGEIAWHGPLAFNCGFSPSAAMAEQNSLMIAKWSGATSIVRTGWRFAGSDQQTNRSDQPPPKEGDKLVWSCCKFFQKPNGEAGYFDQQSVNWTGSSFSILVRFADIHGKVGSSAWTLWELNCQSNLVRIVAYLEYVERDGKILAVSPTSGPEDPVPAGPDSYPAFIAKAICPKK